MDSFGVPVSDDVMKENLWCEEDSHVVTDEKVIQKLQGFYERFLKLEICREGEKPKAPMEFKKVLAMINSALRAVYGLRLKETNVKRFYMLYPSQLKASFKDVDEKEVMIDLSRMGFVGSRDERTLIANEWIRVATGTDLRDEVIYEEGGMWHCKHVREWPAAATKSLREKSMAIFRNLGEVVECVNSETLQNKRTAQLTIEGVYGGRASVNFTERKITIEPRGKAAPSLPPFGQTSVAAT